MIAGHAPPAAVARYVRQHLGPVATYSAHRAPNGDWYLSIRPLASRTAYLLKVCVRGNLPHGLANISNGEPDCDKAPRPPQ